jgi:aromatic ring-opening dioxygenase LigB subunit
MEDSVPIVFGAIAPHGFPIIPELSDDAEGGLATREAMNELGRRAKEAGVEAIVIAGPHFFLVHDHIFLADVARGAGTLFWGGKKVEMNVPVDLELTDGIAAAAKARGVPIALGGYAGNRRYQAVIPIDWGMMTPLWFLGHDRNLEGKGDVLAKPPADDIGPPAILVSPSRTMPRDYLVEFGKAVAQAAEKDGRRIAFVASCDWGHCHREDGPYGYNPASAEVDAEVVAAVKANDLHSLMAITDERSTEAAIDGLWQTLMLAGVLDEVPMDVDFLCYEAPTYYGMIVASYAPSKTV